MPSNRAHRAKPSLATQGPTRWLLLGCGFVALALGLVGLVMPIMPTVPFLIVAAACFARSSESLHQRILRLKHVGPVVRGWEEHRRLPKKLVAAGIAAAVAGLAISCALFVWR